MLGRKSSRDLLAFYCKFLNIRVLRKDTNAGLIGEEGDGFRVEIPAGCEK